MTYRSFFFILIILSIQPLNEVVGFNPSTDVQFEQIDSTNQSINNINLSYLVTINDPSSHILNIQLNINGISSDELYIARKKQTLMPTIQNLSAINQNGEAIPLISDDSLPNIDLAKLNTLSSSEITIQYDVDLSFTEFSPGTNYSAWLLDSNYGMAESQLIFYQIIGDVIISDIEINFSLPDDWEAVTRFPTIANIHKPDPQDQVIVWENSILEEFNFYIWGPIGFGAFDIYKSTVGGVEVITAFYSNDDDIESIASDGIFSIIEYLSNMLGKLPIGKTPQKIVYIFHDWTHGQVHSSDHLLGQHTTFDSGYDSGGKAWRGMAHLIAHNWFMHSYELPFWQTFHTDGIYTEGAIQYYALKSIEEVGLWDDIQANEHLCAWYNDYATYILNTGYDLPVTTSENWWEILPDTSVPSLYNYGIRNIFWYEKVPLILYLLNWKIEDITSGKKSLDDVWHCLFENFPGYPNFRGHEIDTNDLLEVVNTITGYDFTKFFNSYFHKIEPLPFDIVNEVLTVNQSLIPEIEPLSTIQYVRHSLKWSSDSKDSDGDGLPDFVEDHIGTNILLADTDKDGLNDRQEFGVVVDGKNGEYLVEIPFISDSVGDTNDTTFGIDITKLYGSCFMDEYGSNWLYLNLQVNNSKMNPEAYYEVHISTSVDFFQYRFQAFNSQLFWGIKNGSVLDITDSRIQANFKEHMEVIIPMDILNNPTSVIIQGITRYGQYVDPTWGLKEVDLTENMSFSTEPKLFVTDPLIPNLEFGIPIPNITVNGYSLPVIVSSNDPVSINLQFDPGKKVGQNADWWVYAKTSFPPPADWFSFQLQNNWVSGLFTTAQAPLIKISPHFEVFNSPLPEGEYTFYFSVDNNMDGLKNDTWVDSVDVTVEK
jgi:hypothetical protein